MVHYTKNLVYRLTVLVNDYFHLFTCVVQYKLHKCNIRHFNHDLCVKFYKIMCIHLMYPHFQQNNRFNDAYLFKIGKVPSDFKIGTQN